MLFPGASTPHSVSLYLCGHVVCSATGTVAVSNMDVQILFRTPSETTLSWGLARDMRTSYVYVTLQKN